MSLRLSSLLSKTCPQHDGNRHSRKQKDGERHNRACLPYVVARKDERTIIDRMNQAVAIREVSQLTAQTLAGLKSGTLNKILSGKRPDPSVSTVMRFCEALNINPAWLMSGRGPHVWDFAREERGWRQAPLAPDDSKGQVEDTPSVKKASARPSKAG